MEAVAIVGEAGSLDASAAKEIVAFVQAFLAIRSQAALALLPEN